MSLEQLQNPAAEASAEKFDPEAERQKIYAHANERRNKLFEFRRQVFEELGKDSKYDARGNIAGSRDYQAFSDAHTSALDKSLFEKKSVEEAGLTDPEKAALLYQRKYNQIQRDMDSEIMALEERIKNMPVVAGMTLETPKAEESNASKLRVEDMEKMMNEI